LPASIARLPAAASVLTCKLAQAERQNRKAASELNSFIVSSFAGITQTITIQP
jgi:hypothetical protein